MQHVHAGYTQVFAAGGPPGRLQVQVRVHHVPCDTTELCSRRFGAETSKPDVGQPRLKALLRLPQVPFFCKNAPFLQKRPFKGTSKARAEKKGGFKRPFFAPQGGLWPALFGAPPPLESDCFGLFDPTTNSSTL